MRLRSLFPIPIHPFFPALSLAIGLAPAAFGVPPAKTSIAPKLGVSYSKQVFPLIQAKCQACHQPALAGGKLIMTKFYDFAKGGENGKPFVPGKPEQSPLMEYVTGRRTLMPKGGPALAATEIALFRQWIAEGAKDDTTALKDPIDAEHPPVYSLSPVITALAYSPDGTKLAVSGNREILIHKSDGSGIEARLVGQSEKILSLVYSADGKMLAAVGGTPCRFGEIQFWDTTTHLMVNSVQTTFDTLFGASLSPDGKLLGFGCVDNSVRVVTVPQGKQVMRLDNHSDWVLSTCFSLDSKNILSTGRDQALKLTLIEGGSFIDDINTHYGAYRALARHPKSDQVLVAGDDGIPRLYQVFRTKARSMNQEDHNLLRVYEKQPATVTAVAFSTAGDIFAVGAENGGVRIYKTDNGPAVKEDQAVVGGVATASLKGCQGVVYSLAFRPDGKQIAVGGRDGTLRLYDLPAGTLVKSFSPVPLRSAPVIKKSAPSKAPVSRK